jgi:hypothetical protein
MNEPVLLGDILRGYLARLASPGAARAPLDPDRLGIPRQPLAPLLRSAVLKRDGYRCCWCSASLARDRTVLFEVDHIVPWSAGGSDHPVNLRTLCQGCNQQRSNRVSEFDRRALPIVWRCHGCDEWGDVQYGAAMIRAYCLTCKETVQAPHVADLMIGGPVPASGVPALQDGDEDIAAIPLTVRHPGRRFRDDREKYDARRAAARAELDRIRPPAVADDADRPAS